ncbi:MAG: hypothetical protein U0Q15_14010 [Kineosporiaceae bacterium]
MSAAPSSLLPRAARLAVWGRAALQGRASWSQASAAASRDDEPHDAVAVAPVLEGVPADGAVPGGLDGVLSLLRVRGLASVQVVLPAPGDLVGLPGPPATNLAATDAGECLLADLTDGVRVALVPDVRRFGSPLEPGHLVTWRVLEADPRPIPNVTGLADADRELRTGLLEAIEELSRLDVASWREEAAADLEFVRTGALPGWLLPPGTRARQVAVLASALKVRVIVRLARRDAGGSLGAWDAGRREEVLRRLDGVARRAMVAACNDPGDA